MQAMNVSVQLVASTIRIKLTNSLFDDPDSVF